MPVLRPLLITGCILLVPFIAMQFTTALEWDLFDFALLGAIVFGAGLSYELIATRSKKTVYRAAFGIGLLGALLLGWVNGAVGIIGSEDNPANLLYGAVFLVGLIGSLLSRFRPRGMSWTLYTAAIVQFLVPFFALFVWPAQTSWGAAGVSGVIVFSSFFAMMFVVSGVLFGDSEKSQNKQRFSEE